MIGPGAVATTVRAQAWLFAEFTPFLSGVLAKAGISRSAGAMATPEQQKSEHEESRREFICFRPPKGFVNGFQRAAWNVVIGSVGAPALCLVSTLSGLMHGGPPGLVTGSIKGVFFGGSWLAMGYTAAGLQIVEGAVNTCVSPIRQSFGKKRWDPLRGRWVNYSTVPDAYLALFEDNDTIYLAAIRRQKERFGTFDKASGLDGSQAASADGQTYYDKLGLSNTATEQEIKNAYKKLAKHYHPDRNPNPEARVQFDDITTAYKTLNDPSKRKLYDAGGVKAVKDRGEQTKREALRGVFGGLKVSLVTGDVRTSRFSRRMLEDAYMMHEENLVVTGRHREDVVKNVLEMMEGHPGRGSLVNEGSDGGKKNTKKRNPLTTVSGEENSYTKWQNKTAAKVKELASLGIAREVLFVVGKEYDLCHQFALGTPLTRMRILAINSARALRLRLTQAGVAWTMVASRHKWKDDQELVLDTVWKLSVPELEATARFVALSLLLDESASPEERQRRADALADLSGLFVGVGQPYEKANPAAIQKLKDAVLAERKRKQREANE